MTTSGDADSTIKQFELPGRVAEQISQLETSLSGLDQESMYNVFDILAEYSIPATLQFIQSAYSQVEPDKTKQAAIDTFFESTLDRFTQKLEDPQYLRRKFQDRLQHYTSKSPIGDLQAMILFSALYELYMESSATIGEGEFALSKYLRQPGHYVDPIFTIREDKETDDEIAVLSITKMEAEGLKREIQIHIEAALPLEEAYKQNKRVRVTVYPSQFVPRSYSETNPNRPRGVEMGGVIIEIPVELLLSNIQSSSLLDYLLQEEVHSRRRNQPGK